MPSVSTYAPSHQRPLRLWPGVVIVAAVELLALLCEHTPAVPPERGLIEQCRDNFLRVWTREMQAWIDSPTESGHPDPDYVRRRRAVILFT